MGRARIGDNNTNNDDINYFIFFSFKAPKFQEKNKQVLMLHIKTNLEKIGGKSPESIFKTGKKPSTICRAEFCTCKCDQ